MLLQEILSEIKVVPGRLKNKYTYWDKDDENFRLLTGKLKQFLKEKGYKSKDIKWYFDLENDNGYYRDIEYVDTDFEKQTDKEIEKNTINAFEMFLEDEDY